MAATAAGTTASGPMSPPIASSAIVIALLMLHGVSICLRGVPGVPDHQGQQASAVFWMRHPPPDRKISVQVFVDNLATLVKTVGTDVVTEMGLAGCRLD